jgi:type III secretory pathway component EscS
VILRSFGNGVGRFVVIILAIAVGIAVGTVVGIVVGVFDSPLDEG